MRRHLSGLALLGCWLTACSGGSEPSGSGAGTSGATGTGTGGVSVGATGAATGGGSSTGAPAGECLLAEQDCPDPAQKCMPWSAEDDRVPDTTRCCPLAENPKQLGETCQIQDYDGSCLDDCAKGTVCVQDDPNALQGICQALCDVTSPDPCAPNQTCKPFFENVPGAPVVPICMDQCDPLLQDCARPDWSCIPDSPTAQGMSGFLCSPPPPGPRKSALQACALANDCQPGLVCVPADLVPDCSFLYCCTPLCDLTEPDPCPAVDPSLSCVDWMSPSPKWDQVGVCVIPT